MFPFGNTFHSLMHPTLFESSPTVGATPTVHPSLQVHTSPNATPIAASVATSSPIIARTSATSKKRLKINELWATSTINVLLDLYEDNWITINRGNFKAKHWVEVTRDLNARCGTEFAETQCKYKWENIKKTFCKEKQKEEKSDAEPSR
ncbi:hypothetical protein L7F22_068416 [Adiantum nelumboides]|nr:hypothetical protein [Adiantum nelumboides]